MHNGLKVTVSFLVLKSGQPFLTVAERGPFQTSVMTDQQFTEY